MQLALTGRWRWRRRCCVSPLSLGRSRTLRGAMAPHENLFFVEKHYNDSLYRGQRKGTTHTDREIQAAANLLGRRGVVADERTALATRRAREHDQRIERVRASGESLRGGDVVILGMGGGGRAGATSGDDGGGGKRATREWDGCVARIDVANLAAGRHGTTNARKRGEDESSRPVQKLDAGNRWKTEARIAAGGTGGSAELERARRAAHALDGGTDAPGDGSSNRRQIQSSNHPNHPDDDDDDAPVVVLPEDLEFGDDGWSRGGLDGVRSGDLAVPRNAALERDISQSAARAVERADAEALDRSAAAAAAARLAERDAARRRKLAAALAAERDATAAGEGTGADLTGKKKRTRKGRRGVERAHLLVSFGDDDDEDASLGT